MATAPTDITIEEQIACARRELKMRERVYPRWVSAGKMKPEQAEREIAVMRSIAERLEAMNPGLL